MEGYERDIEGHEGYKEGYESDIEDQEGEMMEVEQGEIMQGQEREMGIENEEEVEDGQYQGDADDKEGD